MSFVSGVYNRPYWIIALEINYENKNDKQGVKCLGKRIFANLVGNGIVNKRCIRRSVTGKEKVAENSVINYTDDRIENPKEITIDENAEDNIDENVKENINENAQEKIDEKDISKENTIKKIRQI